MAQNAATVANPSASPVQRVVAALEIASEVLPVSVGDIKSVYKAGERGLSGVPKKVDLNLKYKDGWSDAQKAAADAKCQALCDANTVVTQAQRSGTSASSRYKRAGNTVSPGNDVDHVVDLQLGGGDSVTNMLPLNSSVNRSLGSQIHHQIKNLPDGTIVDRVRIQ